MRQGLDRPGRPGVNGSIAPMSRARVLPAVDVLLGQTALQALAVQHGGRRLRQVIDAELTLLRRRLLAGELDLPDRDATTAYLVGTVTRRLALHRGSLRGVINATGVLIHTNLGRAPLGHGALQAAAAVGGGYSTLEFDLATGQRGSRHTHLEEIIREATGAESGLATNNTAAGLTLTLAALAAGREVVISRGELVEIGGGFRVPDILRGSGALLREVGTTNRTRVSDYAAAISDRTAAILRVHPSNFRIEGFTERPPLAELAALAHGLGVPLIDDQGSGWLGLDLFAPDAFPSDARRLLAGEPSVRDSVRHGADVVVFSGDKLLGGPQAGIIAGRGLLLATIRQHPLMRAVRVDKVISAALVATLDAFTSGRALIDVPVMRMLATRPEALAARATAMAAHLQAAGVDCEPRASQSTVGGGSAPGTSLPTTIVAVAHATPDTLMAALRQQPVPVIARIEDDRVCLDPRTIAEHEDQTVIEAVTRCCPREKGEGRSREGSK